MDPKEIKNLQEFEDQIDKIYDSQTRKLYDYMVLEGENAFKADGPLNKFIGTDLFERLVSHFEETEEYEKCAYLMALSKKINQK